MKKDLFNWHAVELHSRLSGIMPISEASLMVNETQDHLCSLRDDLIERGLSEEEATKGALSQLGMPEIITKHVILSRIKYPLKSIPSFVLYILSILVVVINPWLSSELKVYSSYFILVPLLVLLFLRCNKRQYLSILGSICIAVLVSTLFSAKFNTIQFNSYKYGQFRDSPALLQYSELQKSFKKEVEQHKFSLKGEAAYVGALRKWQALNAAEIKKGVKIEYITGKSIYNEKSEVFRKLPLAKQQELIVKGYRIPENLVRITVDKPNYQSGNAVNSFARTTLEFNDLSKNSNTMIERVKQKQEGRFFQIYLTRNSLNISVISRLLFIGKDTLYVLAISLIASILLSLMWSFLTLQHKLKKRSFA